MAGRLSALTTRGRAFLAAGIAAGVCAFALGQNDLLRVAIFLAALPLVTLFIIARTRYRISASRTIHPARVPVGRQATVQLRLENAGRIPTGLLLLEDKVPYVLGARPRFVLDRMSARWRRDITYPVRSDVRGRYPIGPVTLRITDPFGLVELVRSFKHQDTLLVTPEVHALPSTRVTGEWAATGESRPHAVASDGEEDVTVREYRDGDDLRRVHWRSSARRGELMVRREEQPWQSRATIFLDTRRTGHRGSGPASSFEWSVTAAASIGIHLLRQGYSVRLGTDTGAVISTRAREILHVGESEGKLLDTLAVLEQSRVPRLDPVACASGQDGSNGLMVAIIGAITPSEAEALAGMRQRASAGLAIVLDTRTWSTRDDRDTTKTRGERLDIDINAGCEALEHAGWKVARASAAEAVPRVWSRLLPALAGGRRGGLIGTGGRTFR